MIIIKSLLLFILVQKLTVEQGLVVELEIDSGDLIIG